MSRRYQMNPRERVGKLALASIFAGIGSLVVSCAGHWFWGLMLGVLALPVGLAGFLRSASPHVRGGMMSLAAIVLGLLGIGLAVVVLVFDIILWPF